MVSPARRAGRCTRQRGPATAKIGLAAHTMQTAPSHRAWVQIRVMWIDRPFERSHASITPHRGATRAGPPRLVLNSPGAAGPSNSSPGPTTHITGIPNVLLADLRV